MKKAFLAIAAVALLFATSCTKENNAPENPTLSDGEFLATIDEGAYPQNAPVVNDGMSPKTTIDANRYVIWEAGDEIKINGSIYTTSTTGNTVVFAPSDPKETHKVGQTFHAFFPASIAGTDNAGTLPATQTIVDGKVSNLPMYAYSTDRQLTFHNICAVLKITIPSLLDGTTHFVISSDKAMNGVFTINNNTAEMSASSPADEEKMITVSKSSGSFATDEIVYVAVPAQTYDSLTIEFFDGVASIWTKTISNTTVAVNKIYPITLSEMEYEYVDLGLSVKWATCNIGANNPWEPGGYFAWGETSARTNFTSANYSSSVSGKYNSSPNDVLEPCDDAAHVQWGGNWRMPTIYEWIELIDSCTWVWKTDYQSSGNNGYLVTSNKPGYNNKSIFLPTGGYYEGNTSITYETATVACWSSNVTTSNRAAAHYLDAFAGQQPYKKLNAIATRWYGMPIRPVRQ